MAENESLFFTNLADALFVGSKPLSPADLLQKLRSEDSIRPALEKFYLILKCGVEAARSGLQSWNESQIQAACAIASAIASASRSLSRKFRFCHFSTIGFALVVVAVFDLVNLSRMYFSCESDLYSSLWFRKWEKYFRCYTESVRLLVLLFFFCNFHHIPVFLFLFMAFDLTFWEKVMLVK